jgi:uncharacterized protein YabN with tetrapyrrole methylase and pyrophosphatase domain
MKKGALIIVGTGISVGQITVEAKEWIRIADKVLYCVADAPTERMILQLNSTSESLYGYYGEGKPRKVTYEQMVERTMECVRAGQLVCAAYYGHPGLFVNPSHKSIQVAKSEGYPARMLPAVSSLDCLFCDLGIDPSIGCQILEATDVMLRRRNIDSGSHVILLQVAALGDVAYSYRGYDSKHVASLGEFLARTYPADFEVKSYEAAQFSVCEPIIRTFTVAELISANPQNIHTLYVPPLKRHAVRLEMVEKYDLKHILKDVQLVPIVTHSHSEGEQPSPRVTEVTD